MAGERDEVTLIFNESELPPNFDNLGFMDSVTELYVTGEASSSHIPGILCSSSNLYFISRRKTRVLQVGFC